jgi:Family of unknown function (DUF6167)
VRSWWFVAGAAAGVYATAKARRAAEVLTVDGVHDRLTGWFAGARVLAGEVRTGSAEKETELRERVALVPDEGPQQLEGQRHLHLARQPEDDHDSTGRDDN